MRSETIHYLATDVVEVLRKSRGNNVGGITIRDLQSLASTFADTDGVILDIVSEAAKIVATELIQDEVTYGRQLA